ncbi:hypothetical protein [Leeuwenhoekiella parthenopeia]|uniref:Uncharacterized protein n=1 Tax=Leeuwenhoekiella parthenopeia TaxID=2890320 RepID=A0ABS8GUZ7_9FLAO|nr:hypothetical protein [Leeuwenhoekiella parthenopeia]MCC4213792.1 hypothetical protein [Leeuwenhoekiella parthenopeia]
MKLVNPLLIVIFSILTAPVFAQVGIGTTEPTTMLDVNGTIMVESAIIDKNVDALVAADENGVLTTIDLGQNLVMNEGRISYRSSSFYSMGVQDLSGISVLPGGITSNLDVNIDPGEANEGKIVIKLINTPGNIKITGIQGGYDGRHLYLYQDDKSTLTILNMSNLSLPGNQVDTLTGSSFNISGQGMIELVYDGPTSKWVVISHIE